MEKLTAWMYKHTIGITDLQISLVRQWHREAERSVAHGPWAVWWRTLENARITGAHSSVHRADSCDVAMSQCVLF